MLRKSLLLFLCLVAAACGSSSSNGGSDTGDLSLKIDPSLLRVGALAFLSVDFKVDEDDFDDLEDQGVTIKILLGEGLSFVVGSAVFVQDDGADAITPLYAGKAEDDDETFIVFSLPAKEFEDDNQISGIIQLNVSGADETSSVQITADIDQGAITSFDPENALFDNEQEITVEVQKASSKD